MKKLLTAILLLITLITNAANYYFSSSTGNDGNNGSQASPWKSLGKLNSFFSSLKPGDIVYFKRGDTFVGNIGIAKSGTATAPITLDAYGDGPAPVITGLYDIPSWTAGSKGLYTATLQSGLATCNIVFMDGVFQKMGKMPKGNNAYYNINSYASNKITSTGTTSNNNVNFSTAPNCVGGEVVWKPFHWVLWRGTVTGQTSTTVSYTPFTAPSGGPTENPVAGFGFFVQNHPSTCTELGEWAYSSKTLTMYFGSAGPGNRKVSVSTTDVLITGYGFNYITIKNLALRGANTNVVGLTDCSYITIDGCDITGAGLYSVFGNGNANYWKITNNNISYSNSIGIYGNPGKNHDWTISGNTITATSIYPGMGGSGEGQYFAIRDVGDNSIITNNTVTNFGYNGIAFKGKNVLCQYNYVDSGCFVKDDGSGIYFGGDFSSGSKILNNVVLHCFGNKYGTPDGDMRGHGIYSDDGAADIEISGNTCAYNGASGLFNHNSYNLVMKDNTTYYNGEASIKYYNDGNTTRGITYTGNINFAKNEPVLVESGGSTDTKNFFTESDNNWYCRPTNENNSFSLVHPYTQYNLSEWQSYTGKDRNSKTTEGTNKPVRLEVNTTKDAKTITLDGTYSELKTGETMSSITLQPYSSAVLIKEGNTPPPTTYSSAAKSQSFTRNNCAGSQTGSAVIYTVPAGTYTSTVSQADADKKATDDINANGQAYANTNGTCTAAPVTYSNVAKSQSFTRNNCVGSQTGSAVTYTVPAGTYTSTVSQAAADQKATDDINANGQKYANDNGTCTAAPPTGNFKSNAMVKTFTKNNCTIGAGSPVTYTVAKEKYASTVSQADADQKAKAEIDAEGQKYANENGQCLLNSVTADGRTYKKHKSFLWVALHWFFSGRFK